MDIPKLPIVPEHGRYSTESKYQTLERLAGRSPGHRGGWPQETKDAVLNLYFNDVSLMQIVRKLCLPEKAVSTFISKMLFKSWYKYPIARDHVPGPTRVNHTGLPWTKQEKKVLANPHGRISTEVAQLLGRSEKEVIGYYCISGFGLNV